MLNVAKIKKDFPIFETHPDLVYLDSTATALKPRVVVQAMREYYEEYSANVFRGIYGISERATSEYEKARATVADFINAPEKEEVIFVRSTTEAINLVAYAYGKKMVDRASELVVSIAEHHSNFVPWQQLAFENGATFKVVGVNADGAVALGAGEIESVITKNTVLVGLFHVSNVLGTINPLKKIIADIKRINPHTCVLVDAAQSAPSILIDVQDLGCDFLCFSGHKVMGPTGIGVLWGRRELLEDMYPFQYGGDMISAVHINETTFQNIPHKFEAGTPHIAGAIGLAAAITYMQKIDRGEVLEHEQRLWRLACEGLTAHKKFHIIGPQNSDNRTGVFSFYHDSIHAHDIAQCLADRNICVRSGHHCAMPLHESLSIPASARASFYVYSNEADVEAFLKELTRAEKLFS